MTTPSERTRNLVQAGALLNRIRADGSLPDDLRDEARRLLRHYLSSAELRLMARDCDMLVPEIDPDWI
jgi:hypothetical protein